jgi:adenylate cyclase
LIEAATGTHVWAERYDRDIEDIFGVQDEVGRTIVATLTGRLAAGGAEHARRKPPQLWAAYDYFLQGREQMQRFDAETAAPLLRRAIELDAGYAQAHGWFAIAMYVIYSSHGRPEDLKEGMDAAQRAVALDPLDSTSHRALAMIYSLMRQYDLAGVHFDRAVALNPNDVDSSTLRSLWLAYVGRGHEALESLDAGLRLDPFPPTWHWECRAIALFQARRHAEVLKAFQQMDFFHWWSHCYVAACNAHLGNLEIAKLAVSEVLRLKPNFSMRELERAEWWKIPADLEHLKDGLRIAGLG